MNLKNKIFKKAVALLLASSVYFGAAVPVFAAEPVSMQDKLIAVEEATYGTAQSGALLDRVNRLERDFRGAHPTESIAERVNMLYEILFSNEKGPSLLTQMNAVEYRFTEELSMKSLQKRVSAMEMNITGKSEDGTFEQRIDQLSGYAYGADPLPLVQYVAPANTLIRIALVSPLNAKNLKADDLIELKAAEDVFVDGMLVIAKGAPGSGKITKVRQAKNFGRDAQVEIDFEWIRAIDGTSVETKLGEEAKEAMQGYAYAAGASIAGMAILGPIGVVGGAFVKGRNVNLPAGTELIIQTKDDTILYGLEAPEAAAAAAKREADRKAEAEAKAAKKENKDKD